MITEQTKKEILDKELKLLEWYYGQNRNIEYFKLKDTWGVLADDISSFYVKPTKDLNFLFEVADKVGFRDVYIRKIDYKYYVELSLMKEYPYPEKFIHYFKGTSKDKAEALFLALYQRIKGL